MTDTIFTKIIAREIPAEIIYEDDRAIAILDITPVNPGHTLIIPKKAYINVFDIPTDEFAHLMAVVHQLAPAVKAATGAEGLNIIMNNGAAAGQEVSHAHVHLVPRHEGDGFQHWKGTPQTPDNLKAVADAITQKLD